MKDDNWQPSEKDVKVMMTYFARAYSKRTAAGPDGLAAEMFLHADRNILEALTALLEMVRAAGGVPQELREMEIVLAHKSGRDPQNLKRSYRPICVGSLLMKALERVAKQWMDEAIRARPLHPAIMAYTKGIGHDMAIITVQEAVLHARREAEERGERTPRIYAVGIDIENAFNGVWRELVEEFEWEKLGLRGRKWSIVRSLSGGREVPSQSAWGKDRLVHAHQRIRTRTDTLARQVQHIHPSAASLPRRSGSGSGGRRRHNTRHGLVR
jgi:hypothetical protein